MSSELASSREQQLICSALTLSPALGCSLGWCACGAMRNSQAVDDASAPRDAGLERCSFSLARPVCTPQ